MNRSENLRIVRPDNIARTSWKNGGGWTKELAREPENSTLDSFDWRITTAGTAQDGPFSPFPGVDRTLVVLAGRVTLRLGDDFQRELSYEDGPFEFAGETPVEAALRTRPFVDFNVMTRRGVFTHTVERKAISRHSTEIPLSGRVTAIMSLGEPLDIVHDFFKERVSLRAVALLRGYQGMLVVRPIEATEILIAHIAPV